MLRPPGVLSVVIASRDRPDHLLACLASLQRSARPSDWIVEVIVVDNGAYDPTIEAAALRLGDATLTLTFVREARPGKAGAINTGTAVAQGSVVAFLDDDVTVDEGWIA